MYIIDNVEKLSFVRKKEKKRVFVYKYVINALLSVHLPIYMYVIGVYRYLYGEKKKYEKRKE